MVVIFLIGVYEFFRNFGSFTISFYVYLFALYMKNIYLIHFIDV